MSQINIIKLNNDKQLVILLVGMWLYLYTQNINKMKLQTKYLGTMETFLIIVKVLANMKRLSV